jgi:DNA-binding transcriptional MerR regulator
MRGENMYRYYTEENMMHLKYICVMKYAGFTLGEIRSFLQSKHESAPMDFKKEVIALLRAKEKQTVDKIAHYTKILSLISTSVDTISGKEPGDEETANNLVEGIFYGIMADREQVDTPQRKGNGRD